MQMDQLVTLVQRRSRGAQGRVVATFVWPWVFCPSHLPGMGLKGTSGPVMGVSGVIPLHSPWKTPFQGALMIMGFFKFRSLRSTDAFATCVYFMLLLCRFHLLNKYLILFGAFLSFWLLRDLVARNSIIHYELS